MIYVTGDCHGNFSKFSTDAFPEQKQMTRDDFVIVCGDFGLWHDSKEERWWLKWLSEKPFTILFVGGNHENYDRLYSDEFSVVDFHGGKAQKIRENIYYLMRGEVYTLCGKKFFCFGGALSHDIKDGILDKANFVNDNDFRDEVRLWRKENKQFRINHVSWWKEELPTQEEMDYGLKNLKKHKNEVDFIVTHCAPNHINSYFSSHFYKPNILTKYFGDISKSIWFKKWFFGHYHDNQNILDKYILLYEQIIRIV